MSTLVLTDVVRRPSQCPAQRDHANLALRFVLDAEIGAMKARLLRRSANGTVAAGPARTDEDNQIGWLRDSLAKLQARRDALS